MRGIRRIIKMKNLFIILFGAAIMWQCSPKITPQTDYSDFKEDLSMIKPPIDTLPKNVTDEVKKAPYTPPSFDQTMAMNAMIDSLSQDNLDKKFRFYTVQVYVGNSREDANEVRSKVYKIIPDETPRLEWSQPNFRVKVGKYESPLDAHKTFSTLKKTFPGAVLVSEKTFLNDK